MKAPKTKKPGSGRGGVRKGAGRKPGTAKTPRLYLVLPKTAEMLKAEAKVRKISAGAIIDELVAGL